MAATVANVMGAKKKGRPWQPKDFMPGYKDRPQSPAEQLKIVEALNQAFGGKDLRGTEG